MEPFFKKPTYLWAMVPPATVAPTFLKKNTEPLQLYRHLLTHISLFPAAFPTERPRTPGSLPPVTFPPPQTHL